MAWSKKQDASGEGGAEGDGEDGARRGGRRRGYHHGNLREALIEAALSLIAEKGPSGFSFADAARSAGVSSAAPYRHYRDRDALIADVAKRGFEKFEAALVKAWNDGRPDPFTAFEATGRAYLAFARDAPAQYTAMFEAGVDLDQDPELRRVADRAFAVLRQASDALVATATADQRPPATMVSLHIWAMAHGIASLYGRGDEGRRKIPMSPDELLEAGLLIYLRGLGIGR